MKLSFFYKSFSTIFSIGFLIYCLLHEPYPIHVFETLTYQGFLFIVLHNLSSIIEEVYPVFQECTGYLRSLSFTIAIFITNISWGLGISIDDTGFWSIKNQIFHTMNSLSCVLSMIVCPDDLKATNWFLPFAYAVGYVGFSAILQIKGVAALYSFLDFQKDPITACVIVLIVAAQIPIIHTALVILASFMKETNQTTSKEE